jgi:hypothetical protein
MQRRVVSKDGFRFSDGTVLPEGAFLSVAARPAHFDPCEYFVYFPLWYLVVCLEALSVNLSI